MKLFIILMLALAPLTSAWADKPDYLPEHFIREMPWGPIPFIDCHDVGMDFWIWADGVTIDEGKMFFYKDGTPKKTVSTYYNHEAATWIPADPGCNDAPFTGCVNPYPAMPDTNTHTADQNLGKGDHQQAIYREWIWVPADNPDGGYWYPTWGQLSGVNIHIGIPGYGNVFALAGHMTHRLNLETNPPQWEVISMTPNWEHAKAKDVFAMCSYHGKQ